MGTPWTIGKGEPGQRAGAVALAVWLAMMGGQSRAAWAEEPPLEEARRLLEAGKIDQSLALLLPFEDQATGVFDYDLLIARAWLASGQDNQARFALERLLMSDPNGHEARFLMAELYLHRDDQASARPILQQLAQQELPPTMASQVQKRLAELARPVEKSKTALDGSLEYAIGYDNNISSGPNSDWLRFPSSTDGRLTALGTSAQGEDWLNLLTFEGQIKQDLGDDFSLTGKIRWIQNMHASRHDYDEGSQVLSVALSRTLGKDIYTVTGNAQAYWLDQDLYQHYWGGQLSWQRSLQDYDWFSGYLHYTNTSYPDYPTYGTSRVSAGVTYLMGYGDPDRDTSYYVNVYGGRETQKAGEEMSYLGYLLWGGLMGFSHHLTDALTVASGVALESRHYEGTDPYYLFGRKDEQWTVSTSLDFTLADRWHLTPSATYTHTQSNMELYQYDRTLVLFSLKKVF